MSQLPGPFPDPLNQDLRVGRVPGNCGFFVCLFFKLPSCFSWVARCGNHYFRVYSLIGVALYSSGGSLTKFTVKIENKFAFILCLVLKKKITFSRSERHLSLFCTSCPSLQPKARWRHVFSIVNIKELRWMVTKMTKCEDVLANCSDTKSCKFFFLFSSGMYGHLLV